MNDEDFKSAVSDLHQQFRRDISSKLTELYNDLGSQNVMEWAEDLYLEKRRGTPHAEHLNSLRGDCLDLLYSLVHLWGNNDYTQDYMDSLLSKFRKNNIVRILRVCLPMDRAQALYAMHDAVTDSYGMHWYCDLHEHNEEWQELLSQYHGEATMNKNLYRLLFFDPLHLLDIDVLRECSFPTAAVPVPRGVPGEIPVRSGDTTVSDMTMQNPIQRTDARPNLAALNPSQGRRDDSSVSGNETVGYHISQDCSTTEPETQYSGS